MFIHVCADITHSRLECHHSSRAQRSPITMVCMYISIQLFHNWICAFLFLAALINIRVVANLNWAFAEVFLTGIDDTPASLSSDHGLVSSRWYSSWICISTIIPLGILYVIWIRATIYSSKPASMNLKGPLLESELPSSTL